MKYKAQETIKKGDVVEMKTKVHIVGIQKYKFVEEKK
jgi:hypothetical protein